VDAGLAKIMPGRKARFAGIKNQLRQMIRRKAPKIIGGRKAGKFIPGRKAPKIIGGRKAGKFIPGRKAG